MKSVLQLISSKWFIYPFSLYSSTENFFIPALWIIQSNSNALIGLIEKNTSAQLANCKFENEENNWFVKSNIGIRQSNADFS